MGTTGIWLLDLMAIALPIWMAGILVFYFVSHSSLCGSASAIIKTTSEQWTLAIYLGFPQTIDGRYGWLNANCSSSSCLIMKSECLLAGLGHQCSVIGLLENAESVFSGTTRRRFVNAVAEVSLVDGKMVMWAVFTILILVEVFMQLFHFISVSVFNTVIDIFSDPVFINFIFIFQVQLFIILVLHSLMVLAFSLSHLLQCVHRLLLFEILFCGLVALC